MTDIYVLYVFVLFGSRLAIAFHVRSSISHCWLPGLMWGILGVSRSAAGPALLHCAVSILVVPMFITTAVSSRPSD